MGPNGKKKVLLPNQALEPPEEKEVLEPRIVRKQELERGKTASFDYYIYDIDSKGRFQASSREGYLHLVETLTAHQEYALAATYLRQHGEKLSAYSPQEIAHLERIYKIKEATGDESGEQNAIGLYAAYLLATNPIQSKEAKNVLPGLYQNYLSHFHNITALHLTKEEELRLLKNLLSEYSEPHFMIRLRKLDPDYASKLQGVSPSFEKTKESPSDIKAILKKMQLPSEFEKVKSDKMLLTRGASVVKNFIFDFVTQAIQGTPEQKKWLQDAAIFFRSHSSAETRALGVLFKEILENPSLFTLPPSQRKEWEEWWKKTIDQLQQTSLENAISSRDEVVPDITKPYYRLEKGRSSLPVIPFIFNVKELPPLGKDIDTSTLLEKEIKKKNPELDDWLNKQKNRVSAKEDPLQALEWQRLADDFAYYQNHPSTSGVNLKASAKIPVAEIQRSLRLQTEKDTVEISELETKMTQLANRLPQDQLEKVQHELQQWGGMQKQISLDDIFISLAQKEPKTLQALNHSLDQNDLQQLYSMAGHYLQLVSRFQQSERCLATSKKLEGLKEGASVTEKQELEKQLLSDLLAKREYPLDTHPAYLVFEYYSGILMRKDQIIKLDQFLSGKTANPVMEMIMGPENQKYCCRCWV